MNFSVFIGRVMSIEFGKKSVKFSRKCEILKNYFFSKSEFSNFENSFEKSFRAIIDDLVFFWVTFIVLELLIFKFWWRHEYSTFDISNFTL